MKNYLLIDADDTLWEENIYYHETVRVLADLVAADLKLDHKAALQYLIAELKQESSPLMLPNHHGLDVFIQVLCHIIDKAGLLTSKQLALNYLSERHFELKEFKMCLKEGVSETLPYLADRYHCVFYSQGDIETQLKKLGNSKIDKYFFDKFIIRVKSKEVLASYLDNNAINEAQLMVIGNSLRYDINPAKSLGIRSIYVNTPYTWARDKVELVGAGPDPVVITRFDELKSILL